ncbi:modulator of apoptosis 1-like [Patiria miniata]|uniref:CCHC-type domain-containing protein n=1 Tax=Patiria miniata TaxID=46514 RepID=A0A913ZGS3_PATMI|nr:modulator of apoptosis 1-like [Patiria miniata]
MADAALRQKGVDWCKKDDLRPTHSVLLTFQLSSPLVEDTDILACSLHDIFPSLEGLSRKDTDDQSSAIFLCDFSQPISSLGLRTEINLSCHGSSTLCRVIRLDDSPSKRVTISHLRKSGVLNAWNLRERTPASQSPSTSDSNSSSQQSLPSDFTRSFARCTLAANYRKLRCFSGSSTPSRDEDDYVSWIDHVEGQMDEWQDLDDAEKRKRIREALRPPSLNIINDLRRDNPAAMSHEYLKALDIAFGDTETDDELFVKFHSLTQTQGESPSKFLTRLQNVLRRALRRGVVPHAQSNRVRLSQFIRGILFDEMLLVNLQLRDKMDQPPSFLSLLSMVRKQEDETRLKSESRGRPTRGPGKAQHLQHAANPQTQFSHSADPQAHFSHSAHPQAHFSHSVNPQAQFFYQNASPMQHSTPQTSTHGFRGPAKGRQPRQNPDRGHERGTLVDFCFSCGQEGHIRRRCMNPANAEVVNRKLIKFVLGGPSGNGQGHLQEGTQMSERQ